MARVRYLNISKVYVRTDEKRMYCKTAKNVAAPKKSLGHKNSLLGFERKPEVRSLSWSFEGPARVSFNYLQDILEIRKGHVCTSGFLTSSCHIFI